VHVPDVGDAWNKQSRLIGCSTGAERSRPRRPFRELKINGKRWQTDRNNSSKVKSQDKTRHKRPNGHSAQRFRVETDTECYTIHGSLISHGDTAVAQLGETCAPCSRQERRLVSVLPCCLLQVYWLAEQLTELPLSRGFNAIHDVNNIPLCPTGNGPSMFSSLVTVQMPRLIAHRCAPESRTHHTVRAPIQTERSRITELRPNAVRQKEIIDKQWISNQMDEGRSLARSVAHSLLHSRPNEYK
jgi:hypothetical protein